MNLPALLITVVTLAGVDWIPEEYLRIIRIIASIACAGLLFNTMNTLPLFESQGFMVYFGYEVWGKLIPFFIFLIFLFSCHAIVLAMLDLNR